MTRKEHAAHAAFAELAKQDIAAEGGDDIETATHGPTFIMPHLKPGSDQSGGGVMVELVRSTPPRSAARYRDHLDPVKRAFGQETAPCCTSWPRSVGWTAHDEVGVRQND